ncbi:DNA ligase/mRNA capping enzyme [Gloeophyllum trabeum ATCC 11539]|uniref:DNA ligase/mRNA capping enzyme n=1 Tax=Gloeophyllum trabeum (strain ATCC 11539 / FP-39264 / Madison 617) TaxID=670483 RepID=S7S359_GLOTA|nr:DNA ligase/mRNA capping enzyme [Gloeophyllum trabeum ATCC 11539]EPQ60269.1 DNA ligase/mRNA capping enzyme [Gloeophyllum trabeum ATCC 11539]
MSTDELAEINGVKPKQLLADGEEVEVKSMTSNSQYKVKRTFDHYYCSCPAWRNQGGAPVNARTCKHLKSLLGEAYEKARLQLKNPHGNVSKPSGKGKTAQKRKKADGDGDDDAKPGKKQKNVDDEDEEEDEDAPPAPTRGKKTVPKLLLANKWDIVDGPDPTGWWISEKLDGVRAYYDGKRMLSRLGNPFTPPSWFLDKLPKDVTLDGELFGGRGEFQATVSIVKTLNSKLWENITFQVFDVPSMGTQPFEDRIAYLTRTFGAGGTHACKEVVVVHHERAESREHVLRRLKAVEKEGGEGLMLREPGSVYEGHRSSTLLKIKTFYDAEAVVTGYVPGKGKHKGSTGALKCKMASGKAFSVGSGLSDKQRRSPPKVGAIITYRFQELTKDGVPRFPTFIGEAIDKSEPKDAEVPASRIVKNATSA